MEEASSLPGYRRSYERLKVDASATLVTDKNEEVPSILADLSTRGAGIVSNSPLNVNERITIIMNVPFLFDDRVHKEAKIVWCKRLDENLWQAGLDFGLDNLLHFY